MPLARFDPPANLKDFDKIPKQREAWDEFLTSTFDSEVAGVKTTLGAGRSQFFNPRRATPKGQAESPVSWIGFPKVLSNKFPHDRERALDAAEKLVPRPEWGITFRPQDEYLEWHSKRNSAGKLVSATFTCEGPEYWEALAHGYPLGYEGPRKSGAKGSRDLLLELYRRCISPEVKLEDLFSADRYNRWNIWNTTRGAMHLTHPANTLSAEINIAAQATILRKRNGKVLTDDDDLIECGKYGDPGRASDPHIGGVVNSFARDGYSITLANPVGLYMDLREFSPAGWTKPDGKPVDDYWTIVRGEKSRAVRATYAVPAAAGFVVGDLRIGGEPIRYGGQIAEHITMSLTAVAFGKGSIKNQASACRVAAAVAPEAVTDPIKIKSRIGL